MIVRGFLWVLQDGIHILNIGKTWEKLVLAARIIVAIENPQVCVYGGGGVVMILGECASYQREPVFAFEGTCKDGFLVLTGDWTLLSHAEGRRARLYTTVRH